MMRSPLKPFLTYSFFLHCLVFMAAARFVHSPSPLSNPVYTIDFVGPTTIKSFKKSGTKKRRKKRSRPKTVKKAVPAVKAPPAPAGRRPLPKPSFVAGKRTRAPEPDRSGETLPPRPAEPPIEEESEYDDDEEDDDGTPGTPGAEVSTDLPNFPYPWYISQVRAALWKQWSDKMPGGGECTVVFSLLQNGRLVDLRIEESSGDPGFDLAALSAVQDAGPYPPLPRGFKERFLKIHVTLVSN